MNLKMKKVIAWVLVCLCVFGSMPKEMVKAASAGSIYYVPKGQQGRYTSNLDEALQSCSSRGGEIVLEKDVHYDFPDFIYYDTINKDTTLVVSNGVTLTIGKKGLRMNGTLLLRGGTVDLEKSEGILYGSGNVLVLDGRVIKKSYSVNKNNSSTCLEAKSILYGQKLKEAQIPEDKVTWSMPVEGTWQFVKGDLVPQSGTSNQDIVFVPKYPMTYDSLFFTKSGKVTVNAVIPRRQDEKEVQIFAGQNLMKIHPDLMYVSPVTGEKVAGEFTFSTDAKEYDVGKHEISGVFTPQDNNYQSVTDTVVVDIVSVKPEQAAPSVVRNHGIYGDRLNQIRFLDGKYKNPKTGEIIKGSFEWKDGSQPLKLGTCGYTMLFIPDGKGYETVESEVLVETLPKEMEEFEWPSCSDLSFGEDLSNSSLSFQKNEYGIFFWEDEKVCPPVKNSGVHVVFRPADTIRYDWSKVAGYDEKTKTITCSIPITVNPVKGKLPTIKAKEWKEGETVSGCALSLEPAKTGTVTWKNPVQKADKSGWYPVLFCPADSDNYDWSSYEQDEKGNICMQVYLTVTPKPTSLPTSLPTLTPTPVPTEKPSLTPLPESTEVPSATPVVREKNTSKQGSNGVAGTKPTTTFVITQLVSKTSKIQSPIVPKTSILKCSKKGKRVQFRWKKKKGVSYQVQWSANAKFKKAHKKKVKKNCCVISNKKSGKRYYVRVRCVKNKNGVNYYGKWSKVKKVSV